MNVAPKLSLLWLALIGCVPLQAQDIPQRIEHRLSDHPLWLAASEVEDERGDLNLEILAGYHWNPFMRLPESGIGEEDCLRVGPVDILPPPGSAPNGSLSDLVRFSRLIAEGVVTGVGHGFQNGYPGSLLEISVSEVLKKSAEISIESTFFLFYPKGDFSVGGYDLCVVDEDLPEVPEVGDRLVVFDSAIPLSREHLLLSPRDFPVFVEKPDGSLRVSKLWQRRIGGEALESLERFKESSRQMLRAEIP